MAGFERQSTLSSVAFLAITSPSNVPCFLRIFPAASLSVLDGGDIRKSNALVETIVYTSLDRVEELALPRSADRNDVVTSFFCNYYSSDGVTLHCFVTSSNQKVILGTNEGMKVNMSEVKLLLKQINVLLVDTYINPMLDMNKPLQIESFKRKVDQLVGHQ
mmetsp:Transcript_6785/g.20583  ORF Transcript_6785/g.20583 Transcript_6785/m.20583 type:complete len:161 (+) Transcript_6785:4102-4584(+)